MLTVVHNHPVYFCRRDVRSGFDSAVESTWNLSRVTVTVTALQILCDLKLAVAVQAYDLLIPSLKTLKNVIIIEKNTILQITLRYWFQRLAILEQFSYSGNIEL